ncbi:MAG: hypothetical protein ACFFAO_10160 [Candidatus Hermodarchaeota archaeon]
MVLTFEENLQGVFSLIFAVITLIVAIKIALKYIQYKRIDLLLVGFAFIGLAAPWIAVAVKFVMIAFINSTLSDEMFFIINLGIVPFTALCWIIAMANLMNVKEKLKLIISISWLIGGIIFEAIFLYMVFTDTTLIGTFTGTLQIEFTLFMSIYILIILATFEVPGLMFVRESLKANNPEVRLKGKFLLIGFLFVIIGTVIEAAVPIIIINVIGRSILILSSLIFYLGFILPDWTKNIFLK